LLVGDGTIGWSRYAPYDAILVAAGAPNIPPALVEQLAPNGRMLIPLGDRNMQQLTLVTKTATGVATSNVTACVFVPLLGRFGWPT
jgi:protein-L-isoaspartate(D-aspartate) O-methyltransferase